MMQRQARSLGLAVLLVLGACGPGQDAAEPTRPKTTTTTASEPSATPTVQDVMGLEKFAPLEPGTYFIDPDSDPSTPLRVVYEVPFEGWSQWFGALKDAGDGHVMINITTVVNLVRHGCRDHSWADPPIGPSVDDLAVALVELAPFQVTSAQTDVTMHGYHGKHLKLDRSRSGGRGDASPDASTATSRAGSRPSMSPKAKRARSTPTTLTQSRSSGSSTSTAPAW